MGDENYRAAGLRPDALQFVMQEVAGLRIQRSEGFVHQQNIGLGGQGAGQGHALPHSTRKLMSIAVFKLRRDGPGADSTSNLSRRSALDIPFIFMPNSTFSPTVSQGKSPSSWKIRIRSVPGPSTRLSSTSTLPDVG